MHKKLLFTIQLFFYCNLLSLSAAPTLTFYNVGTWDNTYDHPDLLTAGLLTDHILSVAFNADTAPTWTLDGVNTDDTVYIEFLARYGGGGDGTTVNFNGVTTDLWDPSAETYPSFILVGGGPVTGSTSYSGNFVHADGVTEANLAGARIRIDDGTGEKCYNIDFGSSLVSDADLADSSYGSGFLQCEVVSSGPYQAGTASVILDTPGLRGSYEFTASPGLSWMGWLNIHQLASSTTKGEFISGSGSSIDTLSAHWSELGVISFSPNTSFGDIALQGSSEAINFWTTDLDGDQVPDAGNKWLESYLFFSPEIRYGERITFAGSCLKNPLDPEKYEVVAFIKIFDVDKDPSLLVHQKIQLVTLEDFSVSADVPTSGSLIIQAGYTIEGPNALSSQVLEPVLILCEPSQALNGALDRSSYFEESQGVIAVEAESYHSKGSMNGDQWVDTPEGGGSHASFTGSNGTFMQVSPDAGNQATWPGGAYLDYLIYIPRATTYRFSAKWTGSDETSDSIFYSIRELVADDFSSGWYQDASHTIPDFTTYGYDNLGQSNIDHVTTSQDPITFTFPNAGCYTLRISSREDGAAIDAWKLERIDYDPVPVANDDLYKIHSLGQVRMGVTDNDTGSLDPSTLEIIQSPAHGLARAHSDGTIYYKNTSAGYSSDSFSYRITGSENASSDVATVSIDIIEGDRFETNYVSMPSEPPLTSLQFTDAYPGITFNTANGFCSIATDPEKLLVTEGEGRIYMLDGISNYVPNKILLVDISDRVVHDYNEKALKGIAAHPDWSNNGYIYVTYNYYTPAGGTEHNNGYRLSRFTSTTSPPYTIDPNSELVLIEQVLEGKYHSVASLRFGPDGYLYFGSGDDDADAQRDSYGNSQYIDKKVLSGIFRIDVDLEYGDYFPDESDESNNDSNIRPNTHPSNDLGYAIPAYEIPADNPFVGATEFNGISVDPGEVIQEYFIVGLRNPWQFSVEDLDMDKTVDQVWVGDVGYDAPGEVSVFSAGGNGGWAWHHGSNKNFSYHPNATFNGASAGDALITDPVWDYYYSGPANYSGRSVTGGFLYNGAISQLSGKYLFGDYVMGHIYALDPNAENPSAGDGVDYIGGLNLVVAMIPDPTSEDILVLDRSNGIKRITTTTSTVDFPQTLSETNFFADMETMQANPGGVAYGVNLRFWSDFAEKYRWFLINDPNSQVGYTLDGPWQYPDGMVFVKHFDYPTEWESFTRTINGQEVTDRRPLDEASRRRIETRFLVHTSDGAYGVSYRWENTNEGTQKEANLASANGESLDISINLDGKATTVPWDIPSRSSCITCHNEKAGYSLSFNTRQLNRSGTIHGEGGNFIALMHKYGYLDQYYLPSGGSLPRHTKPSESKYSLEHRARSYLDVNCAYCHQEEGTGGGNWDGRSSLKLSQADIINGAVQRGATSNDQRIVVSGAVEDSVLYHRMAGTQGYAQMPPLAKNEIDLEGVELLANWINREAQAVTSYSEWRELHFGTLVSPEGAPSADPDNDGYNNEWEWMTNTSALNSSDHWQPTLKTGGDSIRIQYQGLGNRLVRIWKTHNLNGSWVPLLNSDSSELPLNPDRIHEIQDPLEDSAFFKFEVIER
ncbi:MAG: PQQ-dependent sugar dehydrogenase [Coraliomargaritaceae bacterium]